MNLLPEELQIMIFLKLLATCLFKCQFVCKSFYKIIQSPEFLKAYLASHTSDTESLLLDYSEVALSWGYKRCHTRLISIDKTSREVSSSSLHPDISYVAYGLKLVGSCNGLICFHESKHGESDGSYLLWNPVLRKTRSLPKPDKTIAGILPVVEFGFVKETNDYMLVKVGTSKMENGPYELQVYRMSKDSWRTFYCKANNKIGENNPSKSMTFVYGQSSSVFFNESFHWMVGRGCIVSFSLQSEKVTEIEAPKVDSLTIDSGCEIAVIDGFLAFVRRTDNYQIWVMKEYGVQDSWVFRYQFNVVLPGLEPVTNFEENGMMIVTEGDENYLLDFSTGRCVEVATRFSGCGLKRFCRFMQTLTPLCYVPPAKH